MVGRHLLSTSHSEGSCPARFSARPPLWITLRCSVSAIHFINSQIMQLSSRFIQPSKGTKLCIVCSTSIGSLAMASWLCVSHVRLHHYPCCFSKLMNPWKRRLDAIYARSNAFVIMSHSTPLSVWAKGQQRFQTKDPSRSLQHLQDLQLDDCRTSL